MSDRFDINAAPPESAVEPAGPYVRVIVVDAIGSTPTDAGASMVVTPRGLHAGTVGGGKVEARAIADAQAMLANANAPRTRFVDWNLKTDVGMTCGGSMKLFFERRGAPAWDVVVFGAGHVAQALVRLLVTLPCQVTCVDARPDWLAKLPTAPNLRTLHRDEPATFVPELPANAFVVSMTRGHATDRPILQAALTRPAGPPPFVGVIGSKSKAAILKRELREGGVADESLLARLVCPVGLPIGENHPGEIAVSIAAQLLQVRDELRSQLARSPAVRGLG
jgi:xanthine dehydrogenase accessory factor